MMTSSNGDIFRVTSHLCGEFTAHRPLTRSFDVFFGLRLNKRLSKQSWGWWFETLSFPLWRHRNVDKPWQQDNLDCFPWEVLAQKFITGFWIIFKRHGLPHKFSINYTHKQRVLMHRHQGWNARHGLCHIYMRYLYIYELFIAFVCFVVCSLL